MPYFPLRFDNRFIKHLPGDPEKTNSLRQVSAAYSFVMPTPVSRPQLVAVSDDIAQILGMNKEQTRSENFPKIFTGNQCLPGMQPYAMCYGGHQFGNWAGQLGDGRAINLGEILTPQYGHQTLQLKGAGLTPYSRSADGRAVLRSSIREFLCSEAMFHLGIPTTRALSLCLTGDEIVRDMFYDGHPAPEPGAIVCRVSASFLRFGSFQLPAYRNDTALLKKMVSTCIQLDFPALCRPQTAATDTQTVLNWFSKVCQHTCRMIVHWMRVGFVHGVMNTDNMSIIGETIDYGPYGWLDDFDPHWTPNTTDAQSRRYRYAAQPEISHWNLYQLANALFPLVKATEPLEDILANYMKNYWQQWDAMMAQKLGLKRNINTDHAMFNDLENLLTQVETDMTMFYRCLAKLPLQDTPISPDACLQHFNDCYYQPDQITDAYKKTLAGWIERYIVRCRQDMYSAEARITTMNASNPKYILRNYMAQEAIDLATQGDFSRIHRLQKLLQHPYSEQPECEQYAKKRPDWARHQAGCSMLSCSS